MADIITLTGLVGTDPRHVTTGDGLEITTFRLASTHRRFDRVERKWVDGDTNWYTISAFRNLAGNVSRSVKRGERVVVTGRLRLRDWTTDERSGTAVEIDADAIGHDLSWGTSIYSRTLVSASARGSGDDDAPGAAAAGADSVGVATEAAAGGVDADGWAAPGAGDAAASGTDRAAVLDDAIPTPF